MSDGVKETIEFGWNILYGIIGAFVAVIAMAMRFGARLQSFVTREELDRYVTKETFADYKVDTKEDFDRLHAEITQTRTEILRAIQGGK